jgi:hypothetical protein
MRIHVLILAGLVCWSTAWGAESKALKKASLAATEQLFADPKVLEISVEVPPAQLEALKKEPRVYVKATIKEGTNVYANSGFRFVHAQVQRIHHRSALPGTAEAGLRQFGARPELPGRADCQ